MSAVATFLIAAVLFEILLLLPACIAYNHFIITPNSKLPLFRIRRPQFLFLFLLAIIVSGVFRILEYLLTEQNLIGSITSFLIQKICIYFGFTTFLCLRVWLLYQDLQSAKKQQQNLLKKQLNIMDEVATELEANRLSVTHQQSSMCDPARLLHRGYKPLILLIVVVVSIITAIDALIVFGAGVSAQVTSVLFWGLAVGVVTSLLSKLWCKCCRKSVIVDDHEMPAQFEQSFHDNWNVLLELFLLWLCLLFSMLVAIAISAAGGNPAVFGTILSLLMQCLYFAICAYCPYSILRRWQHVHLDVTDKGKLSLKRILSNKTYFFDFVQHLVNEVSIENLTFLVVLWQYKYETVFGLSVAAEHQDGKQNTELRRKKLEKWMADVNNLDDSSVRRRESISSHSPSAESEYHRCNNQQSVLLLQSLPWYDLPLADSIAFYPNDKWTQCSNIYRKFITDKAYCSLNIGYAVSEKIRSDYERLVAYKTTNRADILHGHDELRVSAISIETPSTPSPDLSEKNDQSIVDEEGFQREVMCIFDAALQDVVENLTDSLSRFVVSDQFKMLHSASN